jgi:hypothetical protein
VARKGRDEKRTRGGGGGGAGGAGGGVGSTSSPGSHLPWHAMASLRYASVNRSLLLLNGSLLLLNGFISRSLLTLVRRSVPHGACGGVLELLMVLRAPPAAYRPQLRQYRL